MSNYSTKQLNPSDPPHDSLLQADIVGTRWYRLDSSTSPDVLLDVPSLIGELESFKNLSNQLPWGSKSSRGKQPRSRQI